MCLFIPPDKDWIDLLSSLLTPVIAFFGVYLGYQQRAINRNRLKNELFDKRYKVFEKIGAFIAEILLTGRLEKGADIVFLRDTKPAYLLFDQEIKDFILEIHKNAVNLDCLVTEEKSLDGEGRTTNLKKQSDIKEWYSAQLNTLDNRFVEYLRLEH